MKDYSFKAVIFDLDGVITKTASVHAKAWKIAFDEYLRLREKRDGEPFREFTHEVDYLRYVDGKPRYEGVKGFLKSRGISIPYGDPSDIPDKETVCGIGNKKNKMFRQILEDQGAEIFTSTVDFIKSLKQAGIRVGVASSSKNCEIILKSAGLEGLFETRVDGVVSVELGLKGKPEGDIFVRASLNLGVSPRDAVVIEDANSGVEAGRNGGFGMVLGLARKDNEDELLKNGADIVVNDMVDIDLERIEKWFQRIPTPLFEAWESMDKNSNDIFDNKNIYLNPYYNRFGKSIFSNEKRIALFLDYDGTLTPIVERPELAVLSDEMRDVVKRLADRYTVAIVSGRMREDVERLVGIEGLFYAGSHGFDIRGPGFSMIQKEAERIIPVISKITEELSKGLGEIPGALIEAKRFSVAAHYRLVDERYLPKIEDFVQNIIKKNESLRLMSGKKVFEILPNIDWDKGKAIRWIMKALNISWEEDSVVYIGDDVTDEDVFRIVRTRGTGILVSDKPRPSQADFRLSSPDDVKELFERLLNK